MYIVVQVQLNNHSTSIQIATCAKQVPTYSTKSYFG